MRGTGVSRDTACVFVQTSSATDMYAVSPYHQTHYPCKPINQTITACAASQACTSCGIACVCTCSLTRGTTQACTALGVGVGDGRGPDNAVLHHQELHCDLSLVSILNMLVC